MDAFFWRAVITEFLGTLAFLFSTITTITGNADDSITVASDRQLLLATIFGVTIFILVYFTAGIRSAAYLCLDSIITLDSPGCSERA